MDQAVGTRCRNQRPSERREDVFDQRRGSASVGTDLHWWNAPKRPIGDQLST
jgi:hypothetical protein